MNNIQAKRILDGWTNYKKALFLHSNITFGDVLATNFFSSKITCQIPNFAVAKPFARKGQNGRKIIYNVLKVK